MSNGNGKVTAEDESDEVTEERIRMLSEDRKERIEELRDSEGWGPLATGNYPAASLKDTEPPKSGWWTGPVHLVRAVDSPWKAFALCAVLAFLAFLGAKAKELGIF
jgi:hypothetical protein